MLDNFLCLATLQKARVIFIFLASWQNWANNGLYKKPVTLIKDSRVINKLETSLTDDAKVIIYDLHMFSTGH